MYVRTYTQCIYAHYLSTIPYTGHTVELTHQNADRNFWQSSVEYSEAVSPNAARWLAEDCSAVRQQADTKGSRLWTARRFLQLGKGDIGAKSEFLQQ